MKLITTAATLIMAVAPTLAQEVASTTKSGGTISGTLDFEPAVWNIASIDRELSSTWTETDVARLVRLVGVARRTGERGIADALEITFRAAGGPAAAEVEDPRVAHYPAGEDRVWIAEGQNLDLSIEALHVAGDSMAVAGSFVAQLTPGGTEGLVEEEAEVITLDGDFQATLRADEKAPEADATGD